jgi:hypothetical protein
MNSYKSFLLSLQKQIRHRKVYRIEKDARSCKASGAQNSIQQNAVCELMFDRRGEPFWGCHLPLYLDKEQIRYFYVAIACYRILVQYSLLIFRSTIMGDGFFLNL